MSKRNYDDPTRETSAYARGTVSHAKYMFNHEDTQKIRDHFGTYYDLLAKRYKRDYQQPYVTTLTLGLVWCLLDGQPQIITDHETFQAQPQISTISFMDIANAIDGKDVFDRELPLLPHG